MIAAQSRPLSRPAAPSLLKQFRSRRESSSRALVAGVLWPVSLPACSGWGFFLVPFYAILAVAMGTVDPIFQTPNPVWNPPDWDPIAFGFVFDNLLYAARHLP